MTEGLGLFNMAHALGAYAAKRQSLIAANVANADTPGFRARDLASFSDALGDRNVAMKSTRQGHLSGATGPGAAEAVDRDVEASPNGNTVSVETEMMHAAEVRQQHEMALSVYSSGRDILRAALGRVR